MKTKLKIYAFGVIMTYMLGFAAALASYNFDESVKPSEDFFSYTNGSRLDMVEGMNYTDEECSISEQIDQNIINTVMNNCHSSVIDTLSKSLLNSQAQQARQEISTKLMSINASAKNQTDFWKEVANLKKIGVSVFWDAEITKTLSGDQLFINITPRPGLSPNLLLMSKEKALKKIRQIFIEGSATIVTNANADKILQIEAAINNLKNFVNNDERVVINFKGFDKKEQQLRNYFSEFTKGSNKKFLISSPKNYFINFTNLVLDKFSAEDLIEYAKFKYLMQYALLTMQKEDIPAIYSLYTKRNTGKVEEKKQGEASLEHKSEGVEKSVKNAHYLSMQNDVYTRLLNIFDEGTLNALCLDQSLNDQQSKILEIFENIKQSYIKMIISSNWIDANVRKQLIDLLTPMTIEVGSRPKVETFNTLQLFHDRPVHNIEVVEKSIYNNLIGTLDYKPPSFEVLYISKNNNWNMYDKAQNKILIPVRSLNPPYFDPYDDAVAASYGSIGVNIAKTIGWLLIKEINGRNYSQVMVSMNKLAKQNKKFGSDMAKHYQSNLLVANKIDGEFWAGEVKKLQLEKDSQKHKIIESIKTINLKPEAKARITLLLLSKTTTDFAWNEESLAVQEGLKVVIKDLDFNIKLPLASASTASFLLYLHETVAREYDKEINFAQQHVVFPDLYYNLGLHAAFDAYKKALKGVPVPDLRYRMGDKTKLITSDQQFFLAFAASHRQNRCFSSSEAPDIMLVNASVRQLKSFC
ncbi:MAG: endothelin-converting protein, partial [Burkholderiales bacterium]|nr:endothelin-converting protein [Burkholderiales bacterium]